MALILRICLIHVIVIFFKVMGHLPWNVDTVLMYQFYYIHILPLVDSYELYIQIRRDYSNVHWGIVCFSQGQWCKPSDMGWLDWYLITIILWLTMPEPCACFWGCILCRLQHILRFDWKTTICTGLGMPLLFCLNKYVNKLSNWKQGRRIFVCKSNPRANH